MNVTLSDLDRERFGLVTAKAVGVTSASVAALREFCASHAVELCIARCRTSELGAAGALEQSGFRLMDTLNWWARELSHPALPPAPEHVQVRVTTADDASAVRRIAEEAFAAYGGHYHADPRLDRKACDEVYASWAHRSCTVPGVADAVLVAELDARLVGFATVTLDGGCAEGVLDAVDPAARRRGVYRALSIARLQWSLERGARRVRVSTQITNLASQAGMAGLGFLIAGSEYTFHWWRDAT